MDTRRDFLKKASSIAPVVLTLTVRPTFARGACEGNDKDYEEPEQQFSQT